MRPDQETAIDTQESINCPNEVIIEAEKRPVPCLCPKCGITHILNFFWTGTTTPRKYCHSCRETISKVHDEYIYEVVPDMIHAKKSTSTLPGDG